MNNKNLITIEKRTPKERRDNARKAGIASGIARREKKRARELMRKLLDCEVSDLNARDMISKFGIKPQELDYTVELAMHIRLINRVIYQGDTKAYLAIMKIAEYEGNNINLNDNRTLIVPEGTLEALEKWRTKK